MDGRAVVGSLLRLVGPVGVVLLAAAVTGCGRKATEADCQLIVDRSVELQMKEMEKSEREAIEKRQVQLRKELQGEMKDCVGRRVTDKMMACVRAAQSSGDLEKCVK
jgi:hypothetical protein